jgi:hypothetical protein
MCDRDRQIARFSFLPTISTPPQPSPACRRFFSGIVTNSSSSLGRMTTVWSNCFFRGATFDRDCRALDDVGRVEVEHVVNRL